MFVIIKHLICFLRGMQVEVLRGAEKEESLKPKAGGVLAEVTSNMKTLRGGGGDKVLWAERGQILRY